MKKIIALAIATLTMSVNTFAVTVTVNNNPIDTEAVIVEGRTLVPVRGVFEELGYSVEWDANTKTATLSNGKTTVTIVSGMTTFSVNEKVITPEVPQQIINDRFMLPLRAVSEAVGVEVNWDADTKTVVITAGKVEAETETTTSGGLKVAQSIDLGNGVVIEADDVNEISFE